MSDKSDGDGVHTSAPSNAAKAFAKVDDREVMALFQAGHDAMVKDFKDATGTAHSSEDESDAGNARRFVVHHGKDVKYVAAWRQWFIWDGYTYRPDAKNEILLRAISTASAIVHEVPHVDGDDGKKRRLKHALLSKNHRNLRAMLDLASAQPEIALGTGDLDTNLDLLGVPNGVIDLREGKLLVDDERRLITKRAGAKFDAAADCPLFKSVVYSLCNDNATMFDFLQRLVGYLITGHTVEQALFLVIGRGANGKTTFIEVVLDLLGEYGARIPAEALLVSGVPGGGVPNDVARLVGARGVAATEVEQGRTLNEAKIKEVTGGDTLTARFMRSEWFDFRPQFKVLLSGNHLPRIRGADHGIWRRLRLIEFNVTIPEKDQDRNLAQKLRGELPGILNWAIQGAMRWYAEGLKTPDAVKHASDQYQAAEDVIGQFISERCMVGLQQSATLKELTEAYNTWAEANSERKTSSRNLGSLLVERGYAKQRGSGNAVCVKGLCLPAGYSSYSK